MQLNIVAKHETNNDNDMSKKEKLIDKLVSCPSNFTWDEATKLMKQCGFELVKNNGSRRVFRHTTGLKIFLHEPHPQNTLLEYAMKDLIEGLKTVGEINETSI